MEERPLQQLLILSVHMEYQLGITIAVPEHCLLLNLPALNRLLYGFQCTLIRMSVAGILHKA